MRFPNYEPWTSTKSDLCFVRVGKSHVRLDLIESFTDRPNGGLTVRTTAGAEYVDPEETAAKFWKRIKAAFTEINT